MSDLEKRLDEIVKQSKFRPKPDVILINLEPSIHSLSKEEQIYFKTLTEGVFGYSEHLRNETLTQLASNYHVTLIVPHLCSFVRFTIHYNLVFTDLTLLIYAVRMTKSLMANPHLDLKPYIHELLPAILSCALAKKISKYHSDNHWILRDFSAFVASLICLKYSDDLNNMKQRVIDIYVQAVTNMDRGLATTYGAIKGLSGLGEEEVKLHLLPNAMLIGAKIHNVLERDAYGFHAEHHKHQMNEAKHVRNVMVTICAPVLYQTKNVNDGGLSYVKDFGYLGKSLYIQVKNLESMEQQAQYMHQISKFLPPSPNMMLNLSLINPNVPRMDSWFNLGLQ